MKMKVIEGREQYEEWTERERDEDDERNVNM